MCLKDRLYEKQKKGMVDLGAKMAFGIPETAPDRVDGVAMLQC